MSNHQTIYGREIPRGVHPIYFLLRLLRKHGDFGFRECDGLPEKFIIYKDICEMLWSGKNGGEKLEINPWAEKSIRAFLEFDRVGLAGAASTSKSHIMAVDAILHWAQSPTTSMSICTSSTIRESKKRIFGSIEKLFQSIPKGLLPGRLLTQPEPGIVTEINGRRYSQAGVFLIPADKGQTQAMTSKLVGMKADRTKLYIDEGPTLGESLLKSAMANLSANRNFAVVCAGNPSSHFDVLGQFITPKSEDGWASVSVDIESYRTLNGGICLHFDHLKNPNLLARENLWRGIATWESIEKAAKDLGENSVEYFRFWRGWFADLAAESLVVTEADILKYEGMKKATWAADFTKVFGLDAAWTSGGDKTILKVGRYGRNIDGLNTIEFCKTYQIHEDVTLRDVPRNTQICRKVIQIIKDEGGELKNLGVDSTSGGSVFCDALATEAGSNDFYRVNFGGAASDRAVSEFDSTIASEFYANRVTEIWFSFLYYLRAGQIRGMDIDLVKEIVLRRYDLQGRRKIVESKVDMKKRIGKSPDDSDASCILIALCREKLGATQKPQLKTKSNNWSKISRKFDVVSLSPNAEFVDGSEINSIDNSW